MDDAMLQMAWDLGVCSLWLVVAVVLAGLGVRAGRRSPLAGGLVGLSALALMARTGFAVSRVLFNRSVLDWLIQTDLFDLIDVYFLGQLVLANLFNLVIWVALFSAVRVGRMGAAAASTE